MMGRFYMNKYIRVVALNIFIAMLSVSSSYAQSVEQPAGSSRPSQADLKAALALGHAVIEQGNKEIQDFQKLEESLPPPPKNFDPRGDAQKYAEWCDKTTEEDKKRSKSEHDAADRFDKMHLAGSDGEEIRKQAHEDADQSDKIVEKDMIRQKEAYEKVEEWDRRLAKPAPVPPIAPPAQPSHRDDL
jgi:hypothetical protein